MILDIDLHIGRQAGDGLIEPGRADEAPRANYIGEQVDLEGAGHLAPPLRRKAMPQRENWRKQARRRN
jgi:hypothetical protein